MPYAALFFLIFDSVILITSKHCLFYFKTHFGRLLTLDNFLLDSSPRGIVPTPIEHLAKTLLGAVPDLYRRKLTRSREFMCAVRLRDETFPFFPRPGARHCATSVYSVTHNEILGISQGSKRVATLY